MFEIKNYQHLLGLGGLSDKLLTNHFTLYEGYVNNTNKLLEKMNALEDKGEITTPEFAEFKRRFGWEFNGMRLHELYFENLTKDSKPIDESTDFGKQIKKDFSSFEKWQKDFQEFAAMRGIGWVVLYYDSPTDGSAGKFFNCWVNEHDVGHLTGAIPILVIDVFEHAYMLDYGLKKATYLEAIWKVIDWQKVSKRFSNSQS